MDQFTNQIELMK